MQPLKGLSGTGPPSDHVELVPSAPPSGHALPETLSHLEADKHGLPALPPGTVVSFTSSQGESEPDNKASLFSLALIVVPWTTATNRA